MPPGHGIVTCPVCLEVINARDASLIILFHLFPLCAEYLISYQALAGPIANCAFNRLGQYAGSPVIRAYCYAELAVSSLVVAETIVCTHCAYPVRDGQAE